MPILTGDEKAAEREVRERDSDNREHRSMLEGKTASGRGTSLVEMDK